MRAISVMMFRCFQICVGAFTVQIVLPLFWTSAADCNTGLFRFSHVLPAGKTLLADVFLSSIKEVQCIFCLVANSYKICVFFFYEIFIKDLESTLCSDIWFSHVIIQVAQCARAAVGGFSNQIAHLSLEVFTSPGLKRRSVLNWTVIFFLK